MIKRILDLDTPVVQIAGVNEVDILPAVAIKVGYTHAGSEFFQIDRSAFVALEVSELDTGGVGHIGELYGLFL